MLVVESMFALKLQNKILNLERCTPSENYQFWVQIYGIPKEVSLSKIVSSGPKNPEFEKGYPF